MTKKYDKQSVKRIKIKYKIPTPKAKSTKRY